MQLTKFLPALAGLLMAGQSLAQAPVVDINASSAETERRGSMQEEIYQQLQQLRQEMMALRGTVEEQGHQIRQLKQQSLDRYIDLDRRLSGGAAAPLDAAGDDGLDGAAAPLSGNAASLDGNATLSADGLGASASVDAGMMAGDPSADYSAAYALVKARDYKGAIDAFLAYVKRYPDERYTPNAWYWLGELYIAASPQNLPAATEAFQQLLSRYPDNGKVPAAMYKLGTVYFLAGDKQKSKDMLTHVLDRYGNTGNSAVKKSREFLRDNF